jgi:hypothetical protein
MDDLDGHPSVDHYLAEKWGVSRGRVFQIRCTALEKIRRGILADPVLRELASEACGFDIAEDA